MSFFGKLKAKLFRSSSKLDSDLDNLIDEKREEYEVPSLEQKTENKKDEQTKNSLMIKEKLSSEEVGKVPVKKKSFLKKIIEPVKKLVKKRKIDDDLLESLEDILIAADLGVNTAAKVSSKFLL